MRPIGVQNFTGKVCLSGEQTSKLARFDCSEMGQDKTVSDGEPRLMCTVGQLKFTNPTIRISTAECTLHIAK